MTNLPKMAKKLVAVVITLTLLFSMCLTAAVPADASTATADISDLTGVASVADDYIPRGYKTLKDITGGGVNIKFTQHGAYEPYHYPVNLGSFDGIELYFSNYNIPNTTVSSVKGYGQLLLIFANASAGSSTQLSSANKFKPETLGILIDTVNGALQVVEQDDEKFSSHTVYQTLATNNALKYANFTGKEFKFTFNKNGTGVDVSLDVNGTVVSGTITAETLAKFKYCPTDIATYVSIGSPDSVSNEYNTWSVNFFGYNKNVTLATNAQVAGGSAAVINEIVAALPATITVDNAYDVLRAKALYDAAGTATHNAVTDYAKLISAYNTIKNFYETNELEANATYYAAAPEYDNQFPDSGYRTLYSSKTQDGVKIDFNRAVAHSASKNATRNTTLTGKHKLDGLYVSFKNYAYTKQSDFYLAFSSDKVGAAWDGSQTAATKQLVLHLGRDDGRLLLAGCGMTAPVNLGANPIIKRSNMVGKDLSVNWQAVSNGDYYVYITVGDKVAGFRVSKAQMAAATSLDVNNVRVTLSAPSWGNDFEIEVDGIYAETSSSVKNAINAIEALTDASSESTVNAANAAYLALSTADKQHVINYPKLNKLLQKFTSSEGYFVPTVDDVYDQPPVMKALAATNAANGGIKVDANSAVFGMRTALKQRFIGEDITLRFNNYNFNNGYTVVGFTSSVNPGAIWNLEAATGRFGIYFLLGYDNSVWVTVPYQAKTMAKIITDEKLSFDNLMNKEFFVNFKADDFIHSYYSNGSLVQVTRYKYTFSITVDGETLSVNIDDKVTTPAGKYSASVDQFNPNNAQVVIESVANYNPETGVSNNTFGQSSSIELTGIKSSPYSSDDAAKIDKVIAAINALPDTASTSIQSQVDDVWNQYFELIEPEMRAGVTNYAKLKALHDGIFNLRKGNSIVTEYVDLDIAPLKIDNSALVTPYVDDSKVEYDSTGIWPDYTKDLIMAEVKLSKASEGGTILAKDIEPMLKHLAEAGINGLWIMPENDTGVDTLSPYCNYGPHTIDPYLTGILAKGESYSNFNGDYTTGFANFKKFVDLAHSYNIRIFIDIVPWGVSRHAPIVTEHPEYFYGDSSWGGKAYDLSNKNGHYADLEKWYIDSIVDSYLAMGVDGIRWDLEPEYFGYGTVKTVLDKLKAAGKKPLFFSECLNGRSDPNDKSSVAYAFEQCYAISGKGVGSQTVSEVFLKDIDIVKAIKTGANIGVSDTRPTWATNGAAKYYAYQMSSHDVLGYHNVSLASWAYEYAFSSFIPLFYMGEEWNSQHEGGLSGIQINWAELNEADHAEYFESVKQLLGLRWMYKDIVNSTVDNHKNTNICTVDVIGSDHVKGYARYKDNQAIVVVPNVNEKSATDARFTIELPMANMGLNGYTYYTVTDMLTGDMIVSGSAADVAYFSDNIEHNTAGVYLVSGNRTETEWSMSDDGVLSIMGEGAITETPWAAAYATAKEVRFENGITSVPTEIFASFGALKRAYLPSTLKTLPNLPKTAIIVADKGSTIEALAKAAGYRVVNDTSIKINSVVVTKDGFSKVDVYVDTNLLELYEGLKVVWGDNATVTKKTTRGNTTVFNFTTSASKFSVWLTDGVDSSEAVEVDLSKTTSGNKYVYYPNAAYGDANQDGELNIKDLIRAKKMIAELEAKNKAADLNGDLDVTVADLALTAKLIIKGKAIECNIVTFLNAEGTVHEVAAVPSGCKAIYNFIPVKEGELFIGWTPSIESITANTTLRPVYGDENDANFGEGSLEGTIPEDWELGD